MPLITSSPYQELPSGNDSFAVLLVHSDTTNGSTTVVDSSGSAHSLTMASGAEHSTDTAKFGATSLKFPGGTSRVSTSDDNNWNFGNGDFTIDCWVNFITLTKSAPLVTHFAGGSDNDKAWAFNYSFTSTALHLRYTTNGSTNITKLAGTWSPSLSTWYHVAVARDGSNLRFFIDGTQSGTTQTITETLWNSGTSLRLGSLRIDGSISTDPKLDGYMDEVRISKGIARYTGNFTPPTAPYGP